MTKEQMIVAIIVAIIGVIGTSIGGGFAFAQFLIKRKDEKEANSTQKQIDDAIKKFETKIYAEIKEGVQKSIDDCGEIGDLAIKNAVTKLREEIMGELDIGLKKRSEEGLERFEINSKAIVENSNQIGKILGIVEDQVNKTDAMLESLTSLNTVTKACAEGVKSTLYDKLYIVAEKAIKRGGITVDEKANISQLWESYSALSGNGKGKQYAHICLEQLPTITDEEARKRDSAS